MAIYDISTVNVSQLVAGDIINCPYSGSPKQIILPPGQYKLECWGAQGGYRSSSSYGGKGGYARGTFTFQSDTVVNCYAGGSGNSGGYNGGGTRTTYKGGGGATDVRFNSASLYARAIVAGGGGSDGAANKPGSYGGGSSGGDATETYGTGGQGGTQIAGGAGSSSNTGTEGIFGNGGTGYNANSGYAGAGGGGWYGGAGSYPDGSQDDDRGGGGGSGFVLSSGSVGSVPSGYLLGSQYYSTDWSTVAGNTSFLSPTGISETGHTGDGYIRITVNSISTFRPKVKKNGTWTNSQKIYKKINGIWTLCKNGFVKSSNVWH